MADACVFMEHVNFSDLAQGMTEVRNCHINTGRERDYHSGTLVHHPEIS